MSSVVAMIFLLATTMFLGCRSAVVPIDGDSEDGDISMHMNARISAMAAAVAGVLDDHRRLPVSTSS